LQLLSHLTEEVGEVARAINRIYRHAEERDAHLTNLGHELLDVFWLLAKIANRFDVDLDIETRGFVQRAGEWTIETVGKHRRELVAGLQALNEELAVAKSKLGIEEKMMAPNADARLEADDAV
jgi:NTP pyrophosphatase (non-canonical NTP hydrolase)